MARAKKPALAICHPDRPSRLKNLPTTLSAEARQMAEEAAGKVPRYQRNPERAAHFRTSRESVSAFVADVAVKNGLDMEKAVEEMRPELPPGQIAETAQTLKADPNVKAAIERALEKRGLDEASKAHFVSILWRFAAASVFSGHCRQIVSYGCAL